MKNLFLLLLCIFALTSCAVHLPAPKSTVGLIDYTEFTQKGIFVTESNSVSFEYQAIGSVFAEETDGWSEKKPEKNRTVYQDEYYDSYSGKRLTGQRKFVPANLNQALQNIAKQLEAIGANGIINLKIDYQTVPYGKEMKLNRICLLC